MIKLCPRCNKEKDLAEFNKDKSRIDGLVNWCKECKKKYHKNYYKLNDEKLKERSKNQRKQNPNYIAEYMKGWRKRNINYFKNLTSEQKNKRRTYMRNYFKNRRTNDINFKLSGDLRARFHLALRDNQKSGTTIKLLGCSIAFLKNHIEVQFKEGMDWNNHSLQGWHIDHIRPLTSFNLSKKSEQFKACHYTNLQPLWAKDNLEKGNKYYGSLSK